MKGLERVILLTMQSHWGKTIFSETSDDASTHQITQKFPGTSLQNINFKHLKGKSFSTNGYEVVFAKLIKNKALVQ